MQSFSNEEQTRARAALLPASVLRAAAEAAAAQSPPNAARARDSPRYRTRSILRARFIKSHPLLRRSAERGLIIITSGRREVYDSGAYFIPYSRLLYVISFLRGSITLIDRPLF